MVMMDEETRPLLACHVCVLLLRRSVIFPVQPYSEHAWVKCISVGRSYGMSPPDALPQCQQRFRQGRLRWFTAGFPVLGPMSRLTLTRAIVCSHAFTTLTKTLLARVEILLLLSSCTLNIPSPRLLEHVILHRLDPHYLTAFRFHR
jgi:hypothetical protein